MTRVVGYRRVSTRRQADEGWSLEAQTEAIRRHCEVRGWEVVWPEPDAASGGNVDRPGLTYSLGLLKTGRASTLVASSLDRVSRSVLDFADLLERARREEWNVVVLDLGLDLATPQGEFVAHVLAAVAQLERRLIAQRIRAGLAAARENGVRPGPRVTELPDRLVERVTALRDRGNNLTEIAHVLTSEGIPTVTGKPVWSPAQVRRVLGRINEAREELPA